MIGKKRKSGKWPSEREKEGSNEKSESDHFPAFWCTGLLAPGAFQKALFPARPFVCPLIDLLLCV